MHGVETLSEDIRDTAEKNEADSQSPIRSQTKLFLNFYTTMHLTLKSMRQGVYEGIHAFEGKMTLLKMVSIAQMSPQMIFFALIVRNTRL